MSRKQSLDSLIDSLIYESSQDFQVTPGVKWEWDHYVKLTEILDKIRERESGRNGPEPEKVSDDERRKEKFPAFLRWLESNGVDHQNVEIALISQETGYGLLAKKPLQPQDLVFTIPEKITLSSQKVRDSKLKIMIGNDPILRSMQNVTIAMFLLYTKYGNQNGESSFWLPYVDTLPLVFSTIFYFKNEEMMFLKQCPSTLRECLKMLRNVARQYGYFHRKFKVGTDSASKVLRGCFTYNRYIWAVSAVTTRVNPIPNIADSEILALIPLWDMCNHEENSEISTDYNIEEQTLITFAPREFEKGEEFKIFYGRRSSSDFFIHNGFLCENWQNDLYFLELGLGINDLNLTRKRAILRHIGLDSAKTFAVKPERLHASKELFQFIRIFQANSETLDKIESKLDDLNFLNEPSEEVWKFLATRFEILRKSIENSRSKALKSIFGECDKKDTFSQVVKMIFQLFKNEEKMLTMLLHCTNDELKKNHQTNGIDAI